MTDSSTLEEGRQCLARTADASGLSFVRSMLPASVAGKVALLTVAFLVLRLALAAAIPLSIDEAYAVVVSRSHALSYFDHPPLGFALARLMADTFDCECRFVVRLPYVILGSLSGLLLFDLTRRAYGSGAALWALAWYSVAPFFLISAGHFVVPDGPLNFFLLASAWAVAPMLIDEGAGTPRHALPRWIVAGVALGLALMSKYQAGLFGISALILLVSTKAGRAQLATPGPWIAGALAALGLAPVVLWNMEHGWISFAFQSSRGLEAEQHLLHPGNLALTLLGQVAYLLPGTWLVMMAGMWRGIAPDAGRADRFFALLSALPVVFFDLAALFSAHSLPHWPMSGFLFAFPFLGRWCADRSERGLAWVSGFLTAAVIAIPLLAIGFALQTGTAAFTRPFFDRAQSFDVNWQHVDWTALRGAAQADLAGPDSYVVASNWMQGARIALALGPGVPMEMLPGDIRHFQFMNDIRLSTRSRGFLVGALRFDDEASAEAWLRAGLDGRFVVTGEARHVTQRLAGFPVFDILILPVARSDPERRAADPHKR
ncbi:MULTISPECIES: glycosyltransferase family 39 protein [unclassified Mesorhizobium]|uniref:glycosyltransferase family 39 protein n=1 Tax=unclassified Mesorhizobium TaxID=325217 RepID=UPI000B14DD10|nr:MULTISPECIES: glycosyltransferase family 39 protein [unclassified Mesorhizobium]MBN9256282.1 glycosyltransferase family 39 protein [Mesorhizobium sp.]MBN9271528.1 glycosyltransferase family 39 protein [Mesorhizobium sp.]